MSTKFGLLIDFDLLENSDINKCETGYTIERPRPPSSKIDMTSYYCRGWSDLDEIQQRDAE